MLRIDNRDLKRLARTLERDTKVGFNYAVRESLNRVAFATRREWQGEMRRTFELRNNWTTGSVRVEKARGLRVETMQSVVGSLADYMETQEDGGTVHGRGTQGYRRPTARAKPAGKMVRPRFRMKRLKLTTRDLAQYGSTRQKVAVATRKAYAEGAKFVFLDISRESRGMYQVMGSRRRPRLRLIWDMSPDSIRIPKHETLGPTYAKMDRRFPRMAKAAFLGQLKRRKALGY
jgi:hypothetical protein